MGLFHRKKVSLWMHGLGKNPEQGARKLKELGFESVVVSPSQAPAALSAGLDVYLCSGAYRGPMFEGEEYLARDALGRPQEWFSSTCPTKDDVRAYNLSEIRKMAATPGIKGILMDGARFASPASGSTADAFFTCFCPDCLRKMNSMGLDAERARSSAAVLEEAVDHHQTFADVMQTWMKDGSAGGNLMAGLRDWMTFRRLSTTEHLKNFVHAVKEVNPSLQAGMYIFTPSLSFLVGQSYQDLSGVMDLFSPMIYRCYAEDDGPACLNIELAVLYRMMNGFSDGPMEDASLTFLAKITGLKKQWLMDVSELRKALPSEAVGLEVARARKAAAKAVLSPIVQLDDPKLETVVNETVKAGADHVHFFVYNDEWLERYADFFMRTAAS